jgi:cell division protein FtsB
MNRIQQYIQGEKHLYKTNEINAFKSIRPETESQSMVTEYRFARIAVYCFSLLSWSLYIPYFINLYNSAENSQNFTILIIWFSILTIFEVALLFSTKLWYIASHKDNKAKKLYLRNICYILSIISISFSVYSGVNGILTADSSNEKISKVYTENSTKLRNDYFSRIASNDKKINENNTLIKGLQGVALTKKGSAQIERLQNMNDKLQLQNDNIRAEMNKENNNQYSDSKIQQESNDTKTLFFAIGFGIAGIIMVIGIHFCSNLIGKFNYLQGKEQSEGLLLSDEENELRKALTGQKKDIAASTTLFSESEKKKLNQEPFPKEWEFLN